VGWLPVRYMNVLNVYHHYDQRIPYETLRTWKKNRTSKRKVGSGRKLKSAILDQKLFEWFLDSRSLKFPISGSIIIKKARDFKDELIEEAKTNNDQETKKKLESLKFEGGWLQKFKERHQISKRMATSLCKKPYSYLKNKLETFCQAFDSKKNIRLLLNMDETSMYFELSYKQTLEVKGTHHVGIISDNKEKKRATIVLTIGYCPYLTNYPIQKNSSYDHY